MNRLFIILQLVFCTSACVSAPNDIDYFVFKGGSASSFFPAGPQRDLVNAACAGNRSAAERAIANGADPNAQAVPNDKGDLGLTPILLMFECRSPAGIGILIDLGADGNGKDFSGRWAPIAVASYESNPAYLQTLLSKGVDPNHAGEVGLGRASIDGVAAVYEATGSWRNLDLLLEHGYDLGACRATIRQPCYLSTTRYALLAQSGTICKALDLGRHQTYDGMFLTYRSMRRTMSDFGPPPAYVGKELSCYIELYELLKQRFPQERYEALQADWESRYGDNWKGK